MRIKHVPLALGVDCTTRDDDEIYSLCSLCRSGLMSQANALNPANQLITWLNSLQTSQGFENRL